MTLNDNSNDQTWEPGAKPGSVTSINGESISVRLTRLGVEARRGNQHFLAHLIGMAVLEAEQLEQDQLQLLKSPVFP